MQVALAGGLTFVSISPSILISLTRVSNVPHGLVRTVVEEVQSFLTAELLTLKQFSAGVQVRVAAMTEEDTGRQDVELPRLEYHTEDKDDDLLMDDYDVGLLGREYYQASADNASQDTQAMSMSSPSVIMSAHMPLGAGGLAYIAQDWEEGDFVLMVTGTVLPPRPVQLRQDDVKRVEPHKDAFSVTSRSSRDVKPKMTSRRGDHDPSPEKQCAFTPLFEFQVLECVESSLQDALKSLFFCDFWTGPAPAERLVATSGRERLRDQRDEEARRQIQDWKAGSRAQEMEKASKPQDSVKLEGVHQDAPAPDAAETVSVEHARLESLFTEKRQSREAESDAMRAQWPQDMMESWRHEKLALELRIIDAEAEQDRNSEASKIMQKFQAGQLRGLRATLPKSKQCIQRSLLNRQPRKQLFL
ncbi:hypothetical protein GQ600_22783 [Phytophthora cactorum]|nr:hypothetical protein GQ600_22783 [Phytophthora cactorum]